MKLSPTLPHLLPELTIPTGLCPALFGDPSAAHVTNSALMHGYGNAHNIPQNWYTRRHSRSHEDTASPPLEYYMSRTVLSESSSVSASRYQ